MYVASITYGSIISSFYLQIILLLIPWMLVVLSIINITIKRYRDLNNAWYFGILVLLFPIIGWLVWIIDCGFKKGNIDVYTINT